MPKARSARRGPWLGRGRLSCARCRRRARPAELPLDLRRQNTGGSDHRDSSMLSDPGTADRQVSRYVRDVVNGWKVDAANRVAARILSTLAFSDGAPSYECRCGYPETLGREPI